MYIKGKEIRREKKYIAKKNRIADRSHSQKRQKAMPSKPQVA